MSNGGLNKNKFFGKNGHSVDKDGIMPFKKRCPPNMPLVGAIEDLSKDALTWAGLIQYVFFYVWYDISSSMVGW